VTRVSVAVSRLLGSLLSPRGKRGRLAVFCYHQVLDRPDPYRPGEPDLADFEHDVATIGRVFNVLPLEEAGRRLRAGRLPSRAACITFDDGYANNYTRAAPVLERAGLPATFFVTGGAVDEGVMWNDLVIAVLAQCPSEPKLNGVSALADLRPTGSPAARVAEVIGRLKYLPLAERRSAAEALYRDNVADGLPRLMMSREMVADLARRGFDIGGHTLSHPILAELDATAARSEIAGCAEWIREVTGQLPATFAYPNGKPGRDFNESHLRMVQDAGFSVATSTDWQLATVRTDPLNIPRVGPWWRLQRSLPSGLLRAYAGSYRRPERSA